MRTGDTAKLQRTVLQSIRNAKSPLEPRELLDTIEDDPNRVRAAIATLVDQGQLSVSLEWKLRAVKSAKGTAGGKAHS